MTTTDTRPVPAGGWHDHPAGHAWAMLDVDEIVPAPDNPRRSVGDAGEETVLWPEPVFGMLADITAVAIERLESEAAKLACKLLGLEPVVVTGQYSTTKDWRLTLHQHTGENLPRVARAVFLAEGEFRARWTWGNWSGRLVERYLATLEAAGYEFTEAEQAKLAAAVESQPADHENEDDEGGGS